MKRWLSNIIYKCKHNFFLDFYGWPSEIWKEAMSDFNKPNVKFYFYKNNGDFYINDCLLLDNAIINISPMEWKTKYGDYRFEWMPSILIKIFNYRFLWVWEAPTGNRDNIEYYETIMNYLWRYNKDIIKTKENFGWQRKNDNGEWVSSWNNKWLRKDDTK